MSRTCAICARESADLVLSEDGYLECPSCRDMPAREARGIERSYDVDAAEENRDFKAKVDAAYNRLFPEEARQKHSRDGLAPTIAAGIESFDPHCERGDETRATAYRRWRHHR